MNENIYKFLRFFLSYTSNILSQIKLKHLFFFICIFVFLTYYLLPKSTNRSFQSFISCKSDIPKIAIPDDIKRKNFLSSVGDDYVNVEKEFYEFVTLLTLNCRNQEHLGLPEDGGYDICLDPRNDITPPCLVYSFGVGDDFKFEKDIVRFLNCEVHSFDPSMQIASHKVTENIYFHNIGIHSTEIKDSATGWHLMPLHLIVQQLGHQQVSIDLLKMDIEFSEWVVLHQMMESGSIKSVRQLIVEVHTPEMDILAKPEDGCSRTQPETLLYMMRVLKMLGEEGFVLFSSRTNHRVKFESLISGYERYCCYNLHFVNKNHPQNSYAKNI